jgi:hypothetical protein
MKNEKDHVEVNRTDFEKVVLDNKEAYLVYFTTLKEGEDLMTEYKEF